MSELDPRYEKKVLLEVVKQMKDPEETARKQNSMRAVLLTSGSVGLLAAFMMALNQATHPFVSAFLAAAAGCAIGLATFLHFVQKQWPITRKYVDMDRVRKRLDEFGP